MQADDPELVLLDAEERMDKAVSITAEKLQKIRTGRASTGLVEHIKVDYYGAATPLIQLASLTVPDARTIVIQPFDPASTAAIERGIMESDLGLMPNTSGDAKARVIRIAIPDLNEERRKELIRVVRKEAEEGRVAVRNVRREANDAIKKLEKDGDVSEDDSRRFADQIQEHTDAHVKRIDELLHHKEAELLKV